MSKLNINTVIVDDSPLILTSIKLLLREIGINDRQIYTCKSFNHALKTCEVVDVGLFICDFNLGHGLNGLRLLDELKHLNLLPGYATVIMLTGEKSSPIVYSILDYQPDSYILKPYSPKDFKTRLIKCVNFKLYLKQFYIENHNKNYKEAIRLLDLYSEKRIDYQKQITKIKGNVLQQCNEFKLAYELYIRAIETDNEDWAKLGSINSLISMNNIKSAEDSLHDWLGKKDQKIPLAAFDTRIKLLLLSDEIIKAQELLETCNILIPNNAERWLLLGHVYFSQKKYTLASNTFENYNAMVSGTFRNNFVSSYFYLRCKLILKDTNVRMLMDKFTKENISNEKLGAEEKQYYLLLQAHNDLLTEKSEPAKQRIISIAKNYNALSIESLIHLIILLELTGNKKESSQIKNFALDTLKNNFPSIESQINKNTILNFK
ncbi:response regulator [Shewanella psychrotolerans]|uniref:response regulator n=1 Tax=Shewanella psychrotolerans TaxID=2864206 RepID=UPI001C658FF9|nr:response regulator [Shewanella psychrotolerans]QYK00400.1 response regulator [Shewanella psychrotolerans]